MTAPTSIIKQENVITDLTTNMSNSPLPRQLCLWQADKTKLITDKINHAFFLGRCGKLALKVGPCYKTSLQLITFNSASSTTNPSMPFKHYLTEKIPPSYFTQIIHFEVWLKLFKSKRQVLILCHEKVFQCQ